MPSLRRRASAIDDESVETVDTVADHAKDTLALADEAEAEAAEAEALATAARARAKAARLRREAQESAKAEAAAKLVAEPAEPKDAEDLEDAEDFDEAAAKSGRRHLRLPLPSWKSVAATLMVLVTCAAIAVSVLMIIAHRKEAALAQNTADFTAAGKQSVVTLMSLDFNKADEDVQRIIDNSTGQFHDDFKDQAANFAKVAKDAKVITEVQVNTAAVKTMTDNTATVLVSATSRVTNSKGAKEDPRAWRLSVDLARDGNQIKMSKVEFVP